MAKLNAHPAAVALGQALIAALGGALLAGILWQRRMSRLWWLVVLYAAVAVGGIALCWLRRQSSDRMRRAADAALPALLQKEFPGAVFSPAEGVSFRTVVSTGLLEPVDAVKGCDRLTGTWETIPFDTSDVWCGEAADPDDSDEGQFRTVFRGRLWQLGIPLSLESPVQVMHRSLSAQTGVRGRTEGTAEFRRVFSVAGEPAAVQKLLTPAVEQALLHLTAEEAAGFCFDREGVRMLRSSEFSCLRWETDRQDSASEQQRIALLSSRWKAEFQCLAACFRTEENK